VLLATACSSTGDAGPTTGPRPTAASSTSAPTSAAASGVEVLEVVDGDTLRVVLDGGEEEVRLLGINAPEHDECFGDRAREALEQRLAGGPLRLGEGTERDQYGRLLAYAYAGDTLLNLALVQNGLALALHAEHPRLAEFLQADEQAYSGGIGIWAVDACGPPSMAPVTIIDLSFDPPGRDEDDLNGEWVLLADRSDLEADLSGWVLRDESSDHRYHFPAGTVLQPGGQVRVHTGSGNDGEGDLFWGEEGPVWNNGGDTALLLDPAGNVAGRLRYSGT
jgi:micrococcal nuclease